MPINIGKNLKIEPTNDTKVSKFVRNYDQIHNYIEEQNPRNIVYYAYVYPKQRYVNREVAPFNLDVSIVYSTKELTSSSGEPTGSVQLFYSTNYTVEPSYGYLCGIGIMTSVSEVESSSSFTGNITEFYSNGFKDSYYKAIRCPNLDIYDDGTIGNGEPYMYAYTAIEEESGEDCIPVFFPRPFRDLGGYYVFELYEYEGSEISLSALNESGHWFGDYETMTELPDGTFETFMYGDEIMSRAVNRDLTDIGVPKETPLKLYDLLMSLITSYSISYTNLPSGATFEWKIGSETLSNPANVKEGQVVEYTLTYSDGSECVDSFVVSGDYTLNLSSLEPNKFILTVTANKPLTTVWVYHNYTPGSTTHSTYSTFTNNTLNITCNKNENVRVSAKCLYWAETPKTPDYMNLYENFHDYTNITQNISETYNFAYEAYSSLKIQLKNENDEFIDLDNSYLSYITWIPTDSSKFVDRGIQTDGIVKYYSARADKTNSVSYTINVPNYATITGTFGTTSLPTDTRQTKTLIPLVTYTIVPYPSDATVTLAASGYTQQGNSITVPKGTNVVWMVAKEGYETQSGNIVVNSTQSVNVVLEESTIYGVDVIDYNYTNNNKTVVLTKYIGAGGNIVTPGLEEIIR